MNGGRDQEPQSALVATDIAGCIRLMAQDSDSTVVAWQTARSETNDPGGAEQSGRTVKHAVVRYLASSQRFGTPSNSESLDYFLSTHNGTVRACSSRSVNHGT